MKLFFPLLFVSICAAVPQPAAPSLENRFLVIVETSSPMEKRAEGLASTLDQLVRSGFQGQARPGDTIGIWTYSDNLTAGEFPLQTWSNSKESGKRISSGMLAFLADQKLNKQPHFSCVVPALEPIVKGSPFITVVIVCTGAEPVKGTPFDKEISKEIANWRNDAQKTHMPIVVVLRATHGAFTHHTVTLAPWKVDMPPLPDELVAAPAPKPAPRPVAAPPQTSSVAPLIVVGKHKNPALQPGPSEAQPANSIIPEPANVVTSRDDSSASIGNTATSAAATNLPALAAVPEAISSASPSSDLIVHAREITPLAAAPAAAPRAISFSVILTRSLIAAAVLAVLSLLIIFRRPRQTQVSLITHSINRDRH